MKLARLRRAGDLTAVWVPDLDQEMTRDLSRARDDMKGQERKAATKRSADGQTVHSFHSLLADLATIAKNRILITIRGVTSETQTFERITRPTPLQQKALDLLGVRL